MLRKSSLVDILSDIEYDDILVPLTDQLKSLATKSDWPQDIIDAMSVKVNKNFDVYVDYPKNLTEQIDDLEYGTPGQLPNAVIRPFMYRAPALLSNFMEQNLLSSLLYKTGVM